MGDGAAADSFEVSHDPSGPYKRLLIEILGLALADLNGPRQLERVDAYRWIAGLDDGEWFEDLCDYLNVNPEWVRDQFLPPHVEACEAVMRRQRQQAAAAFEEYQRRTSADQSQAAAEEQSKRLDAELSKARSAARKEAKRIARLEYRNRYKAEWRRRRKLAR